MNAVGSSTASHAAEHGGRRSRRGYWYQDLCALRYCIRIATDGSWEEVWCESHDDIMLVKRENQGDRYRFVQVKFEDAAAQHWSCAQLWGFERVKKSPSIQDSIVVKLFESDHHQGESDFRLVVNEGVSDELRPFYYKWNSREPTIDLTCKGAVILLERLREWTPSSGRTVADFIQ